MRNKIYLIGSMGSGKTTIGKMLASKLHLPFIDIDRRNRAKGKNEISQTYSKKMVKIILEK